MLLKLALACWLTGAVADDATTYHAFTLYPQLTEQNPFVAPLQSHPGWMVTELAIVDGAGTWASLRYLAPKHRKLAVALFIAGGVFRGYLAARNLDHMTYAERVLYPSGRTPQFLPSGAPR